MAVCFVYPIIVSNLFEYFVRYAAIIPGSIDLASLHTMRKSVLSLLVVTEIAFIALTFMLSLFMSHRIAGPIYKLRKNFDEFARGGFDRKLYFRKKDYFPELADDFNLMTQAIREREIRENEILATAATRIEAALAKASPESRDELETALVSIKKLQEQRTPSAAPVTEDESAT
jgi:methyl-accepting chemotaxis protein